jgi:hypothetical protein
MHAVFSGGCGSLTALMCACACSQLIESRKYVERHRKLTKPTIVERYANFGSTTYAPVQRDGRFPETKPSVSSPGVTAVAAVLLSITCGIRV